jgi:hypothetical protein
MNYLVVAGGGGSGGNGGGGGGAGGLLQGSFSTTSGERGLPSQGLEFTVIVGAGGQGFTPGGNSSLSNSATSVSVTATGGGRGANRDGPGAEAQTGGSGGGGSAAYGPGSQEYGVAGTPGQGNPGGNGTRSTVLAGGGGGGAGGSGGGNSGVQGGSGGNGVLSTISGYPTGYAGGGGGSGIDYGGWNGYSGLVHYSGGIWYGGGGWQTQFSLGQRDGRRNSGGGGGGLGDGNPNAAGQSDSGGGTGGSGVVIVNYVGPQRAYGGNTYSILGNTVHVFHQTGILYTYNPTSPLEPVTTGLVVHLDAADPRSFPGPNTTALGTSVGVGFNRDWNNLIAGNPSANISYSYGGWPGLFGGAIYFDGSTQYATIPSLSGFNFSSFTVEVWFKSDSVANYRNVIDCNYSAGGSNMGPRLEQNSSGGLTWIWGSSTANSLTLASSGISTSGPYQAVITRTGSTAIGYLNGSQIGSAVAETYSHSGAFGPVNIGQGFSSASDRWYQGYVHIVRLYSTALTGAQVSQNFLSHKTRFGL